MRALTDLRGIFAYKFRMFLTPERAATLSDNEKARIEELREKFATRDASALVEAYKIINAPQYAIEDAEFYFGESIL